MQSQTIPSTPNTQMQTTFNFDDLKQSMSLLRSFYGIPVQEKSLQSEAERLDKYLQLQNLNKFLQDAPTDPQAIQVLTNNNILAQISSAAVDSQPLEYSSDEELMYKRSENPNQQHDYDDLDIFHQRFDENGQVLQNLDYQGLTAQDQVRTQVDIVLDLLKKESGKHATKRLNFGDIISTKIETSVIIQPHLISQSDMACIDKNNTLIYGNVKAIIPLMRERLGLEFDENEKPRYKRGIQVPIKEKRIFGIMTKYQVGHIPSVDICFTEDEETFLRDTYIFKSLESRQLFQNQLIQNAFDNSEVVSYSQNHEMYKLQAINDYSKEALRNEDVDQFVQVGTLNQIEIFHKFLMNDLYREEKCIDFMKAFTQGREMDKKYYLVPLKLSKYSTDANTCYHIDRKLMAKVEKINNEGYKAVQKRIFEEMKEKNLQGDDRINYMKSNILVKEDKPHRCYHFFDMFENLKNMSAEDFAVAIKGKPENLACKTAYDLLFIAGTRFQSIHSFRSCLQMNQQDNEMIQQAPIMLLDPTKVISHRKFKYALDQCPKNIVSKKQQYKKSHREKNDLTTSQGKPIFSSHNIYRHYLTLEQWNRSAQLPLVMLFFERNLYTHQLAGELGVEIHPEFVLWATSSAGVQSSKKCYQTLETYGDTILKLAATLASFEFYKKEPVDEVTIDRLKVAFITNLYLLRIGKRLKLNRYMRSIDADLKTWNPPFSEQVSSSENLNCTGKNIADCVESILGAHFMTNNLRQTFQLIADMRIVPLDKMGLLEMIPDKDLTFVLGEDIDAYQFELSDTVDDIFQKYFQVQCIPVDIQHKVFSILAKDQPSPVFGEAFFEFLDSPENLREMGTRALEHKLIDLLLPVETILNYEFQNKFILLEAFTHKSFKDYHGLSLCYEKLEILGDAILDYIANSNLIKYTILEKYNLQERLQQQYITPEDFQPFDAHQAKSLLTKNDFLAKLVCLFGFHKYILYNKPKQLSRQELKEKLQKETDGVLEEWKLAKKLKEQMNEKDADKFIKYSFKRNFFINGRETEIFEAPKFLGDVFEAIIGAVFVDGGIEKVLEVFQHLLSPFILFTAKFSKKLYKEPKEDFILLANLLKIKPIFPQTEIELHSLDGFIANLENPKVLPSTYTVIDKKKNNDSSEIPRYQMYKVDIVYNGNEVMTSGYGNSKKQAERNASIQGFKWLQTHKMNQMQL